MLLFYIKKISRQTCSVCFPWKPLRVSCQVFILAAVFCPLRSEQDLQVAEEPAHVILGGEPLTAPQP